MGWEEEFWIIGIMQGECSYNNGIAKLIYSLGILI
jgi:hypothetical protein